MERWKATRKLLRLSQIPGLPPMPSPGDQMAPMGAPPPEQDDEPVIPGPIDDIDKLIVDSGIKKKLSEPEDFDNIITEIWQEYGGKSDGLGVYNDKVGQRTPQDEDRDINEVKKEIEDTKNEKWKRLPFGKTMQTLEQPITIADISNNVRKMVMPIIKEMRGKETGGQPGGLPPMMPPI